MRLAIWAIWVLVVSAGTASAQFTDVSAKPVIGTWLMKTSNPNAGYGPEVGFCVNRFAGPAIMLNPEKPKDGIGFLTGAMMGEPGACKINPQSKATCVNSANKDRWECTVSAQGLASCTAYAASGKIKLTATGPRFPGEC